MYRLEAENFLLELRPEVHRDDLLFPVNTSLKVRVSSCGFSGESVMDMDVRGLAIFSASLSRLCERLQGSARLEEPYGSHCYVEFTACRGGHIKITGDLHKANACGYAQELAFENEIDQTYLNGFARALWADYAKYAEQ